MFSPKVIGIVPPIPEKLLFTLNCVGFPSNKSKFGEYLNSQSEGVEILIFANCLISFCNGISNKRLPVNPECTENNVDSFQPQVPNSKLIQLFFGLTNSDVFMNLPSILQQPPK